MIVITVGSLDNFTKFLIMKIQAFIFFFIQSCIVILSSPCNAQYSPGCYALKDVNVIDGISKKVLSKQTIIIREDIIEVIGPVKDVLIPDSCAVFNYSGRYIIPGLIDTHIHLATTPSGEDNRPRAERDLQAMLLTGITSVRDMAGDARELASLSRDALVGDIISPDIYYAALMAGPSFFKDPRTQSSTQGAVAGEMPYMKGVTDSTNLIIAVASAKGTGATAIKLYAQLTGELAKKITREAHHQGMPVWSHADLTIASPLEVINAGVNSISHAGMMARWPSKEIPEAWLEPESGDNFWDKAYKTLPVNDYVNAMLNHKTILDPTLLVYQNRLADSSLSQNVRARTMAQWQIAKRFTQQALEKGVPVCTGTDTDEDKFVQREIKLLVKEAGFTPMEAIISSTRIGAMAIGIEKSTGTIQAGKIASLAMLSANPVADIDNLDKVELVIKRGRLFSVNKK